MVSLLHNVVLDGKLLHEIPLDLPHAPLGTGLKDVVGGPQLVVENRAGKTLQHFLIPGTMNEPFVDYTVIFFGILFFPSVPHKVSMAIIQVAKVP